MKRLLFVIMIFSLLIVPLNLAQPPAASAQTSTMTINTVERGSGAPVLHACYTVTDLVRGGGVGACDKDDNNVDGTTFVESEDPCGSCRVTQSLPNPAPGVPTEYLVEPFQDGGFSTTYTFRNFYKPYFVVTFRDAHTRAPLRGACIAVGQTGQGTVAGGCDGEPGGGNGDQDGAANGAVQTKRVGQAGIYQVSQTTRSIPAGYVRTAPVDVNAKPAETGEFEAVTFLLSGNANLSIKTVDSKTKKTLKGACYAVSDKSIGGSLGRLCDGGAGDQDGKKNGLIKIKALPGGHSYLIDQKKAPAKYRLTKPNKTVTTAAGRTSTVIIKNRPKR